MVGASVQGALEALKLERDRLNGAIASLEGLVSGGGRGAGGGGRKGRRGRPAKAASAGGGGGGKRKNAPRGLLKSKIHQALKGAKKAMAPVDLRNAVMKSGYPNKNPKTLYTAIFAAAKADPAIKKTSDGFSLK
jgi:hypothetical protein